MNAIGELYVYDVGACASPGNDTCSYLCISGYFISSMAQNKWQRLYNNNIKKIVYFVLL